MGGTRGVSCRSLCFCWSPRGLPLSWPLSEHPPLFPSPTHQGMVLSAEYIKKKLEQEMVLSQAFGRDLVRRVPRRGALTVPSRPAPSGAAPEGQAPSLSLDPWLLAPSLAQSLLPPLTPSSYAPAPLGYPGSAPPRYKRLIHARQ